MRKLLGKIFRVDRKLKGWNGYARFDDGRYVYDKDVAKFVWEHLRYRDMLNSRKIVSATLSAFGILSEKDYNPKDYKNFRF